MIWWILLGILVVLLILPLGVSLRYDEAGVRVLVLAGPVRFIVFPAKKKEEKPKKKEPPKASGEASGSAGEPAQEKKPAALPEAPKPPAAEKKPEEDEAPGGSWMDFLPLVELTLKFVGEFFGKTLHIDVLYLKLTMAGDDPADLAINYGRAWAALGNLWPRIDDLLTIKKRDIRLQCDFEASETLVNARVDITVTLARLLGLVINYGVRILIKFLKIQNKRNEQAKTTQTNEGGAIK